MGINAITGSGIMSSNVQPVKSDNAQSSDQSEKSNKTVNYSTASISDLETLAAQGDVQAQMELAKRKAAEGSQDHASSSSSGNGLNVVA